MKPQGTFRRRGQPLLALALLMTSWIGARAAMWEAPVVKPVAAKHGALRPTVGQKPGPLAPRGEAPAYIPGSPSPSPAPGTARIPRSKLPRLTSHRRSWIGESGVRLRSDQQPHAYIRDSQRWCEAP